MPNKTKIEWTDYTSNPIYAVNSETGKRGHFCVHASEGCRHCYAETLNRRFGNGLAFRQQDLASVRFVLNEDEIRSWGRLKKPGRIFLGDMTDLFGPWVPDEWLDRIFAGMALAPQQTFQLLTKRAGRLREYVNDKLRTYGVFEQLDDDARAEWRWPLPNVWLGASVEDQRRADERIPDLLRTPAAVRFLSAEPLLSGVDLSRWLKGARQIHMSLSVEGALANRSFAGFTDDAGLSMTPKRVQEELKQLHRQGVKLLPMSDCPGFSDQTGCPGHRTPALDWVIAGGESGPKARPAHPDWFRALRDQCLAAGVPFFFKQWGSWRPSTIESADAFIGPNGELGNYCSPSGYTPMRKGDKKSAGRLLDRREWSQSPEVREDA